MDLKLGSGEVVEVIYRRWNNSPQGHARWHACKKYLAGALQLVQSEGRREIMETVVLVAGRGPLQVVATNERDTIVYARRCHKQWLSRFVRNRAEEVTSKMSLVLCRSGKEGSERYLLLDFYFGGLVPTESHLSDVHGVARAFWDCHAYVYTPGWIIPGTVITEADWLLQRDKELAAR